MPDINWGGDSSTAPFSSRLDEANGDLILAEDNSGGTVLLEYDGTTWQYRGAVDMNGENISGVGTLTATDVVADSVSTDDIKTETEPVDDVTGDFSFGSTVTNSTEYTQFYNVIVQVAESIGTNSEKTGEIDFRLNQNGTQVSRVDKSEVTLSTDGSGDQAFMKFTLPSLAVGPGQTVDIEKLGNDFANESIASVTRTRFGKK
jgi:hypothetical protein